VYKLLPNRVREPETQTIEVVDGVTYYVPVWEDSFLLALGQVGTIRQACMLSGISRSTYYTHFQYSPPFRQRCNYAREDAKDLLFEEAHRRAVEGVQRPVFFQGQQVGTTTEYSDHLMAILLKGTHQELIPPTD
jgi:hypothetical protein